MASSINPFESDEEILTQRIQDVQPPAKKSRPKTLKPKTSRPKKSTQKVLKVADNNSGSESEDNDPAAQSKKTNIKKPQLFLDSEDYETPAPIRASALRNFLSRKTASGYTMQTNHWAKGEYYIELRAYHMRDLEPTANEADRWKKAVVTFKGAVDESSPTFAAVCDVVKTVKEEYKGIQPVLYPFNV